MPPEPETVGGTSVPRPANDARRVSPDRTGVEAVATVEWPGDPVAGLTAEGVAAVALDPDEQLVLVADVVAA